MAYTYDESSLDPFDGDQAYPERYRTASEGGTDPQFTVDASPNFPPARSTTTPTRYVYYFPGIIDVSDLTGAYPIVLKDGATTLSRVAGTPGINEYRVPTSTAKVRNMIEFHSGQAGQVIDYDLWVEGGILPSSNFNNIDITGNVNLGGNMTATGEASFNGGLFTGDYESYNIDISGGIVSFVSTTIIGTSFYIYKPVMCVFTTSTASGGVLYMYQFGSFRNILNHSTIQTTYGISLSPGYYQVQNGTNSGSTTLHITSAYGYDDEPTSKIAS